jgi:hypothetical protein
MLVGIDYNFNGVSAQARPPRAEYLQPLKHNTRNQLNRIRPSLADILRAGLSPALYVPATNQATSLRRQGFDCACLFMPLICHRSDVNDQGSTDPLIVALSLRLERGAGREG